ncbi:hypothetical protein B4088_1735 [Bacillus cereus]|uniref:Uncharacterized protein n=1 Tax=Bacillus cereus TaxID=1396 RepID=A0A164PTA5_BACCE|nr:hypothetical protein B4088_1735 [Bacillus cereus]
MHLVHTPIFRLFFPWVHFYKLKKDALRLMRLIAILLW